jgi:transcriptional regulator with PAS, ATPase and Fis domain
VQDGEVRAVGGERARKVNVRVVAATHRDLSRLIEEGRFREDLYYRLAVVTVDVPPLRARPEDVPPLVMHFLEKHAKGRDVRIAREALDLLGAHTWPGNVRQLENELQRALVLADDVVEVAHLSPAVRGDGDEEPVDELDLKGQQRLLEKRLIKRALDRARGNQTKAAQLLGLSRYGLQKMLKRL